MAAKGAAIDTYCESAARHHAVNGVKHAATAAVSLACYAQARKLLLKLIWS